MGDLEFNLLVIICIRLFSSNPKSIQFFTLSTHHNVSVIGDPGAIIGGRLEESITFERIERLN